MVVITNCSQVKLLGYSFPSITNSNQTIKSLNKPRFANLYLKGSGDLGKQIFLGLFNGLILSIILWTSIFGWIKIITGLL